MLNHGAAEVGFGSGDKVMTPGGPGVVQYCRMAPPDFLKVAVYSVKLDTAIHNPNYNGSLYPADQVKSLEQS